MIRAITAAATLSLLAGSGVSAQSQPDATPLPPLFEGVRTAVILNAQTDPALNALIDATAQGAHEDIGGRIGEGRRNDYSMQTQPDAQSVVRSALDLAQAEATEIVLTTGGDSQSMMGFARNFPSTAFLDIGQPLPCVDMEGRPDASGACEGSEFSIASNYMAVDFAIEDAAYLAGVLAASASRDDRIGIIAGRPDCPECQRLIEGFTLGAQSVKPDIAIQLAYLAQGSEYEAFGDPATAKTFAKAFIDVFEPDVLLPVAKAASMGMVEAACEAGILAVGTNGDVTARQPDLADCVLTSITTDMEFAVREAIFAFSRGMLEPTWRLGLEDGRVDVTDEWTTRTALPVDVNERYNVARDALITGLVDACPTACGPRAGREIPAAAVEDPGVEPPQNEGAEEPQAG